MAEMLRHGCQFEFFKIFLYNCYFLINSFENSVLVLSDKFTNCYRMKCTNPTYDSGILAVFTDWHCCVLHF